MQRAKTSKPKSRIANNKIPTHIHSGLWSIIFSYIGVNKNLANCRLVCKKWKKYYRRYLQMLLIERTNTLESFNQNWKDILESADPNMKKDLDAALELKSQFEEYIELIPKKYSLFHRVSDLGRLNRPPVLLHYGILSVMYLLATKDELKKEGGALSWKFSKKKLQDKNFMKIMKEATPEKITQSQITRFEELVQASLITPMQLAHESTQACYMMEWALKIIEYKNFTKNLSKETKETLGLLNVKDQKQGEIDKLQMILETA